MQGKDMLGRWRRAAKQSKRSCIEGDALTALETLEVQAIAGHEVILAKVLGNVAITGGVASALFGVVRGRDHADLGILLGHDEEQAR